MPPTMPAPVANALPDPYIPKPDEGTLLELLDQHVGPAAYAPPDERQPSSLYDTVTYDYRTPEEQARAEQMKQRFIGTRPVGWQWVGRNLFDETGHLQAAQLPGGGIADRETLRANGEFGNALIADSEQRLRDGKKDRNFFNTLLQWPDVSMVPFMGMLADVGGAFSRAKAVSDVNDKVRDGKPLTIDEAIRLEYYLDDANAKGTEEQTVGTVAADILRHAPGFAVEFIATGGLGTGARALVARGAAKKVLADATAQSVGRLATYGVNRGAKTFARELADRGLAEIVSKGLADQGIAYTQKAAAEYLVSDAGKAAVKGLSGKLATSIKPFVAESLGGKATGGVLGKSVDAVSEKVALSVAQTAINRRLAVHGATSAAKRAANGTLQWLQRYASKAALDWGSYGDAPETMLNFTFETAGKAAASAVGIGLIEAPIKGLAQMATVKAVQNAVLPAFGISPVSATELGIKTRALNAGSTDVYDDAKYMAFASDLLEYVSENAGAAFGSAFVAGALGLDAAVGAVTRKAAPKAAARYVGEIGGLFTEEAAPKAAFRLGRLVERSLGTRAEREAKLRADQEGVIRELFRSKNLNVTDAELRRVVRDRSFDAIQDPAAKAFASAGKRDYRKLLSDAVKSKYASDTKRAKTAALFRYLTADFMVRKHMGPVELSRFLKRFGYDGFIEEMLEERYSGFVSGLLGLDAQGTHDWFSTANVKQAFKNVTTELGKDSQLTAGEQLLAESVGFAIPMLVRAGHQKVFRWATGGAGELDAARRFARDFADGHSSLSVYESPFGSFYDGQRKALDDMEARIKAEDDKLAKAMDEYRRVGAEKSAPARDAQARRDEAVKAIREQITRQESFLRRTMLKNADALGIKADEKLDDRAAIEEIVKNNRDNMMMYVAYSGANANQEAYSDAEARQIADARDAASSESAGIGRLLWRSREASWEGMGIGRRIAAKLTGLAAAIVTGDIALAQSDAVDWALVDAGVGRPAVAALRELYGKFYDETRAKIVGERIDKLSPTLATSAKPPTREEVEARMDQDGLYAAKAKETVNKLMSLAGARAFHRSDVRDQVIMYVANREGWKYNGGAKSFERDGEVVPFSGFASRGATDAEREANRKEVEDLMNEVSAATVRMVAQSGQYSEYRIPLGRDPGLFTFLNLPSAALGRDSIAMGLAAKLAGFGDAVTTRRVTEAATVESQLDEGSVYLPEDAVDRIADALEPTDEDIGLVAAAFHRDARLGAEDERRLLRSQIVGMCRLLKLQKSTQGEQRIFTGDIPVKDTRLWDTPTFQLVFKKRGDGRWHCTSVADPTLTGGKDVATAAFTDEELAKFAEDNVLTESAPKLVITPVEVFASNDPALLLKKLGQAAAHVRACSVQAADGTVDYSGVHPRFRPNPGLSEVDALRVAEETARREELLASLYDPEADGNLDYFNWGDEKKPSNPNDTAYRQLMTQRRNMCRAAYNARKSYMTDIEARLRAIGCSTPNTQDYLNLAIGPRQELYTCPVSMWASRTGSQYVAVDFARGQDPQSAICAAIVTDAVRRHNALLSAKGPSRGIVSDFMKDMERLLASVIPELGEHDAALVSDLRRDLFGPRVQSTIPRRTLVETIVAVACGQAARAKRIGYSATAHSAAFAVVEDRVKRLPSYMNFLSYVDLILGGDGFSRLYTNLKLMREGKVKGRESADVIAETDRGLARLLSALDGRAPGQARAATVTRDVRPAGMSVEALAQSLSNASFRNLRVRAPEGSAPGDKPKAASPSDFASIQKAIISAIDLSKIDQALTGATDEERNAELERRVKEFFSQLVVEFQGKGESRYEFGGRINRAVPGVLANTTLEIERLAKHAAELEEQLRKADEKSREELSSRLDPLLKQEAQLMKYVKEYSNLARARDWETLRRIFDANVPEEQRRGAAERFAARRNAEQDEINRAYKAHANALSKLRDAKKLDLTDKDLNDNLLRPLDVVSWWADQARARKAAEKADKARARKAAEKADQARARKAAEKAGDVDEVDEADESENIFGDGDPTLTEGGSRELIELSTTDVNFLESADVDEVVDADGSIRVVTKVAKRDDSVLTPEAVEFTARAVAALFRATRGQDAVMTDADFDELMLKLTYNRLTETDAEYVRAKAKEAVTAQGLEAFADPASDAPTETSSANKFDQGDRNAELLDGKELRSFLQVAELVSPATGRNLQQYINLVRQGVASLLADEAVAERARTATGAAPARSEWGRQLDVLNQILNPRAVNRVVNPDGSVREFRDGVDRQAYYDYLLKGIGTPGGFDVDGAIARLANGDSPLMTFFLSFIRGLDPNSRCRFMDLVCSSAQMGRMGVTPGTDGNLYATAEETTFTAPTEAMLTGSFSRIISLDRTTVERLANEVETEVKGEFAAVNAKGYRPGDLEAARRVLAPLEKLFGRGSPMLQAIRSAQLATAMDSISEPETANAVRALVAKVAHKAPVQENGLPKIVNQALKLARDYAARAERVKGLDERRHLLENLVMSYLMGGTPGDNQSPEKAANYTSDWVSLINYFTGWMPVALERARTIPARNPKVGSNIAVTARGLPPLVAKFVFAPMSDETSFASMAYRVWRGDGVKPSDDAVFDVRSRQPGAELNEDSLREFFSENILPQCRQDLCWPDAARTPLMVKKIDRDRDDGETLAACRNSFYRLRDETPRRGADNNTESAEAAKARAAREWAKGSVYVPMYHADHSTNGVIQIPSRLFSVANRGRFHIDPRKSSKETYLGIARLVNSAISLDMLGIDTKRSSLSCNESVGVSMRGVEADGKGGLTWGENRFHVVMDFALPRSANDAFVGSIFSCGYAVDSQALRAKDPNSRVQKTHVMSSHGGVVAFTKGCTVGTTDGYGRFVEDSVTAKLDEYIRAFRKGTEGRSTSSIVDRDAIKVGQLVSETVGHASPEVAMLALTDPAAAAARATAIVDGGDRAHENLYDYVFDRLAAKADAIGGTLSGTELDKALCDRFDADGKTPVADTDGEFRFTWVDSTKPGEVQVRRVTIDEVFEVTDADADPSSGAAIQVNVIKGAEHADDSGKVRPMLDFSFVDNGAMSYAVANVSHQAKASPERMPRNNAVDILTFAVGTTQNDESKRLMKLLSGWGLISAMVASDPAAVAAALSSESVAEMRDAGVAPGNESTEDAVAYEVFARLRKLMNPPLNAVYAPLVSCGAVYRDGKVYDHSANPFFRDLHRGSTAFGATDRLRYGAKRRLGYSQINCVNSGIRYGWFVKGADEAAQTRELQNLARIMETYTKPAGERAKFTNTPVTATDHLELLELVFTRYREVERLYTTGKKTAEDRADFLNAKRAIGDAFVDHHGVQVSKRRAVVAEKDGTYRADKAGTEIIRTVFRDLFTADGKFDRTAVDRIHAPKAVDASQAERTFLGGSYFGLPRTPSYNGSMWLQVVRASVPVTEVKEDDGTYTPGRDAAVSPDAQTNYILGCDHDGDKALCYMLRGDVNGAVAELDPGLIDPSRYGVDVTQGPLAVASAVRDRAVRRRFVDGNPLVVVDKAGPRLRIEAKAAASNAIVANLADMARNVECTVDGVEPGANRTFADTDFARPTKARPIADADKWKALLKKTEKAFNFRRDRTKGVSESETGAHVGMSADDADKARGAVVALAAALHMAYMSGQRGDIFRTKGMSASAAFRQWVNVIYLVDGISNATFDDVKEQICLRLGWTPGLVDVLYGDLLMGPGGPAVDEESMLAALDKYVDEIGTGRGMAMMLSADNSDSDIGYDGLKLDRLFPGWDLLNEDDPYAWQKGKGFHPDGDVSQAMVHDAVLRYVYGTNEATYTNKKTLRERFGIKDSGSSASYTRKAGGGKSDRLRAARQLFMDGFAAAVQKLDEKKRSAAYRSFVRELSRDGSKTPVAGYVAGSLAQIASAKTADEQLKIAAEAGARVAEILDRSGKISEIKRYSGVVNCFKADPGDARKMGRRDSLVKDLVKWDGDYARTGVPADVRALRDTLFAATVAAYEAGEVQTRLGRMAIASEGFDRYIVDFARDVRSSPTTLRAGAQLVSRLFASTRWGKGDVLQREGSFQQTGYFLSALMSMPRNEHGVDVMAGGGAWDVMRAMSYAMNGMENLTLSQGEVPSASELASNERANDTFAFQQAVVRLFSALYAAVSTSTESAGKMSAMHRFSVKPVYKVGDEGAHAVRRDLPHFRLTVAATSKDHNSVANMLGAMEEMMGADFSKLRRVNSADADATKCDSFILSVDSLKKLLVELDPNAKDIVDDVHALSSLATVSTKRGRTKASDIASAIVILDTLEKSLGLRHGSIQLTPKALFEQFIPLYSTTAARVAPGSPTTASVIDHIPGVCERLTEMHSRLDSGILDVSRDTPAGARVLDLVAACNLKRRIASTSDARRPLDDSKLGDDEAAKLLSMISENTDNDGNSLPIDTTASTELGKRHQELVGALGTARDTGTGSYLDVLDDNGLMESLHEWAVARSHSQGSIPGPEKPSGQPDPALPQGERVENVAALAEYLKTTFGPTMDVRYDGGMTITIETAGTLGGSAATLLGLAASAGLGSKGNPGAVIRIDVGSGGSGQVPPGKIDVNSPTVAASFVHVFNEAVSKRAGFPQLTVGAFMRLTEPERRALVDRFTAGGFRDGSNSFALARPSWSIDANGVLTLAGYARITTADSRKALHEYFHSMIGIFRACGAFTDADVAVLRDAYGAPAEHSGTLFNEERAADEFVEYVRSKAGGARVDSSRGGKVKSVFRRLLEFLMTFVNLFKDALGFSYKGTKVKWADKKAEDFSTNDRLFGAVLMAYVPTTADGMKARGIAAKDGSLSDTAVDQALRAGELRDNLDFAKMFADEYSRNLTASTAAKPGESAEDAAARRAAGIPRYENPTGLYEKSETAAVYGLAEATRQYGSINENTKRRVQQPKVRAAYRRAAAYSAALASELSREGGPNASALCQILARLVAARSVSILRTNSVAAGKILDESASDEAALAYHSLDVDGLEPTPIDLEPDVAGYLADMDAAMNDPEFLSYLNRRDIDDALARISPAGNEKEVRSNRITNDLLVKEFNEDPGRRAWLEQAMREGTVEINRNDYGTPTSPNISIRTGNGWFRTTIDGLYRQYDREMAEAEAARREAEFNASTDPRIVEIRKGLGSAKEVIDAASIVDADAARTSFGPVYTMLQAVLNGVMDAESAARIRRNAFARETQSSRWFTGVIAKMRDRERAIAEAHRKLRENLARKGVELAGFECSDETYNLIFAAMPFIAKGRRQLRDAYKVSAGYIQVMGKDYKHLSSYDIAGAIRAANMKPFGSIIAEAQTDILKELKRLPESEWGQTTDEDDTTGSATWRSGWKLYHALSAVLSNSDATLAAADGADWNRAVDEFFANHIVGVKPSRLADGSRGPFWDATSEPLPQEGRNREIYALGAEAGAEADAGRELRQRMIGRAVSAVLVAAAQVKFARELGMPVTAPNHNAFVTGRQNGPSFAEVSAWLGIGRRDVESEEPLVAEWNEPVFIATHINSWLSSTVQGRMGTCELKKTFMSESQALRGCIDVLVNAVNRVDQMFGVDRRTGAKIGRLRRRKATHVWGESGFIEAAGENAPEYEGIDNARGFFRGSHVDVSLDKDDARVIDLFMKCAQARMRGGDYIVTGCQIRFNGASFDRREAASGEWISKPLTREALSREALERKFIKTSGTRDLRQLSSLEIALRNFDQQWGSIAPELTDGYRARFVDAVVEAQTAWLAEAERRAGHPSAVDLNDFIIRRLAEAGLVIATSEDDAAKNTDGDTALSRCTLAFKVDDVEAAWDKTAAYAKLVEAGRDKSKLTMDWVIGQIKPEIQRFNRAVAEMPWLTRGDARYLNGSGSLLRHFSGNGQFMMDALKAERDRETEAATQLARHEATYIRMLGNSKWYSRPAADMSGPMLDMVHDYFNTPESGEALRRAIRDGEYGVDTPKSARTGLTITWYSTQGDFAKEIYTKLLDTKMRILEGRELTGRALQDEIAVSRMIRAYEGAADSGQPLSGGFGLTDEAAYRLNGLLPASTTIGHMAIEATAGVQAALYFRSTLINMLSTPGPDGHPLYFANPSAEAVEASGIPDEVWEAIARHNVKALSSGQEGSIGYDITKTGIENARIVYAEAKRRLDANKGTILGHRYTQMAPEDMEASKSIDGLIVRAAESDVNVGAEANNLFTGGEAMGYARQLFQTAKVLGSGCHWVFNSMQHIMAWSKALKVSLSAFFPLATRWESPTGAVGALATILSNLSPKTARRYGETLQKISTLGLGRNDTWMDETFLGFKDILEMMDTDDPFLSDLIMYAESLGITMTSRVANPADGAYSYVQKDMESLTKFIEGAGKRIGAPEWAKHASEFVKIIYGSLMERQGEKAFTYAMNATKLAVAAQVALRLKHEAMRAGKAFDPVRDLSKFAEYIDSEVGGVNPVRYAWATPGFRYLMNILMFSWQWTRTAWEAGGGGILEDMVFGGHHISARQRSYTVARWARMAGAVMFGFPLVFQMTCKALALALAGIDDPDDPWFTWNNDRRIGMSAANIRPLLKMLAKWDSVIGGVAGLNESWDGKGVPAGPLAAMKRNHPVAMSWLPMFTGVDPYGRLADQPVYVHMGKQGWEFVRWPMDFMGQLVSKLSMALQATITAMLGRPLGLYDRGPANLSDEYTIDGEKKGFFRRVLGGLVTDIIPQMVSDTFTPFTVSGLSENTDAGVIGVLMPVQRGTSYTNIRTRIEVLAEARIRNDAALYLAGRENMRGRTRRFGTIASLPGLRKGKRYEEAEWKETSDYQRRVGGFRDDIARGIIEDARRNHMSKDTLAYAVQDALLSVRGKLMGELLRTLPKTVKDDFDADRVRYLARCLYRSGYTHSTILDRIRDSYGTKNGHRSWADVDPKLQARLLRIDAALIQRPLSDVRREVPGADDIDY